MADKESWQEHRRVTWERGVSSSSRPLVLIQDLHTPRFPPGDGMTVHPGDLAWPARPLVPWVVVGERGSGVTSFARWVQGTLPALGLEAELPHVAEASTGEDVGGDTRHLLRRILGSNGDLPRVLVVDQVERLGADAPAFFAKVRGALETGTYDPKLQGLFLLGHDETLFDEVTWSGLLSLCKMFRTPYFEMNDLVGPQDLALAPSVAASVLDWTGGQPLLVSQYLDELHRHAQAPPGAEPWDAPPELLRRVGMWLVAHPPDHLRSWRAALLRQLDRRPTVVPLLRDLMRDDLLRDPPPDVIGLYLSGWLSRSRRPHGATVDAAPSWGLSRAHQAWAKDALREYDARRRRP